MDIKATLHTIFQANLPLQILLLAKFIMGRLLYSLQLAAKVSESKPDTAPRASSFTLPSASGPGTYLVHEGRASIVWNQPLYNGSRSNHHQERTSDSIYRLADTFPSHALEEGRCEDEDEVGWLTRSLLERGRTVRGGDDSEEEDLGAELTRQSAAFRQAVAAMEPSQEEMDGFESESESAESEGGSDSDVDEREERLRKLREMHDTVTVMMECLSEIYERLEGQTDDQRTALLGSHDYHVILEKGVALQAVILGLASHQ